MSGDLMNAPLAQLAALPSTASAAYVARGMEVDTTELKGVMLFRPRLAKDPQALATCTFDAVVAAEHGIDAASFVRESQARSAYATLRGLHGRSGHGEARLVRCVRGAIFSVVVDARAGSRTYGRHEAFWLDDRNFVTLYVPRGFLHGYQVVSDIADVCARAESPGDGGGHDVSVRYDDSTLAIAWPTEACALSPRDAAARGWEESAGSCVP